MRRVQFVFGIGLILLLIPCFALGQSEIPEFEPIPAIPRVISFFAPLLIPKIIQDEYRLKEYIRSDEFAAFRKQYGDLLAVDAVFHHALQLSWNNVYEALLISFMGTMDHSKFGVKVPLLGPLLWVPLTSEFGEDFGLRIHALPTQLYEDTPKGQSGDRDKLQHFFGSAFLTYVFESDKVAEQVGNLIELGEQQFVVDGALDQRDMRANRQGQEFALLLLDDDAVLPSRFFRSHLKDTANTIVPGELCLDSLQCILTSEWGCQ